MTVNFKDNSGAILSAFHSAVEKALEECGLVAEGYAKKLASVDTGNLRNKITHKVVPKELAVYVGTNVEYGSYQEFGTGIYTDGGRDTPWVYQDEKGNWHWTRGNKAQPFLKPSVADHQKQYSQITEQELRNG